MDDDLGDLDDIMGDDYAHGYDDAEGDPNIKPKVLSLPCCARPASSSGPCGGRQDCHARAQKRAAARPLGAVFGLRRTDLTEVPYLCCALPPWALHTRGVRGSST